MKQEINYLALIVAALVPLVMGFIWYNTKTLGNIWMKESGTTPDMAKKNNMVVVFGVTFLFSLMISFAMHPLVIHQWGALSMMFGKPMPESFQQTLTENWLNFRTFKHGALHGFIYSLFLILPIMGTNALFETKSWKYIFLNAGYWSICMMIMGGIICAWV